MKPEKHILDPDFRYRPSYATDIRKTFERALREVRRCSAALPALQTAVALKKLA